MTQEDFVTQILAAEETAKGEIAKARKKAQNDLAQYENSLIKNREIALESEKNKFREKLKERQVKAKELYEVSIADGKREAAQLEKDMSGKIAKQIPMTQAYFINELIA